jgi:5'-3' exonuclease
MGIPYYFYTLTQKYHTILSNNKPTGLDIYCIDFNGVIHNVAQDVIKKYSKDGVAAAASDTIECEIISGVWERIKYYFDNYKAAKYIICADGVAPLAKMFQQRKRRYLNIYKNTLDNAKIIWDTNAITPGTLFMDKLNEYISKNITQDQYINKIIYSGSNENGEGEHKIFNILKETPTDARIIIHGLDADLIILSLMSRKDNIYLMREMKDQQSLSTVFNYLNIKELRKAILCELKGSWDLGDDSSGGSSGSGSDDDLIETYCTACSILGNDFIPHLLTVELKNNGIETLMFATKNAIKTNGLLVKNGEINHNCLIDIFKSLANTEDEDIHRICERYIKKKPPPASHSHASHASQHSQHQQQPSDYYGLKNKDPLISTIYNSPNKWRQEYYRVIFDNNISIDSTVMFNACNNYIAGIYWVYSYYKGAPIDCEWYYPYNYPPTIKDILNHSIANEPVGLLNSNSEFVPSYIQLLIVLPKYSFKLLSKKHQRYMLDIYGGLFHLYPVKYNIQTFLKTQLWECSPSLPLINLNYIKRVLEIEDKKY